MTEEEDLLAVYASLPKMQCRGLCQACCGPISMTALEGRRMDQAYGGPLPRVGNDATCPALKDGRCSIYEARPLICRLWGMTPDMPCPYGCKPDREMPDEEIQAILAKVISLGGGLTRTTVPGSVEGRIRLHKARLRRNR